MKSPEEILRRNYNFTDSHKEALVIRAMKEYAAQFTSLPDTSWLRTTLFASTCMLCIFSIFYLEMICRTPNETQHYVQYDWYFIPSCVVLILVGTVSFHQVVKQINK